MARRGSLFGWLHGWKRTVAVVIVVLIAVRIALPAVIRLYINRQIDASKEYEGSVRDVDLHILRGVFRIEGVDIFRVNRRISDPFVSIRSLETSIEWGRLIQGELVTRIVIDRPRIAFVQAKAPEETQVGRAVDWRGIFRRIIPTRINYFIIRDGSVAYSNVTFDPPVHLYADSIDLTIRNITNSLRLSETLFANATMSAAVMGSAPFSLRMRLNPLAKEPTFDLSMTLERLQLRTINNFLENYAFFNVTKGTFAMYSEIAAQNDSIRGYVTPFIKDVAVTAVPRDDEGDEKNVIERMGAAVLNLLTDIFENPRTDRLATRIAVNGAIEQPDINLPAFVATLLYNAFIRALIPGLSYTVSLNE